MPRLCATSGAVSDPGLNVYGPSKAYRRYLTDTLYGELEGTGVYVSALCPGPVRTNWSASAGRADSGLSLDPEYVAEVAFEGMQNHDLTIVPGLRFKAARAVAAVTPTRAIARALAKFQSNLRR